MADNLIDIIFGSENRNPLNWMINIAPTVSYNAIPSMFMVAPSGTTNLDAIGSIPILSKHSMVTGTVAVLNVWKYENYETKNTEAYVYAFPIGKFQ